MGRWRENDNSGRGREGEGKVVYETHIVESSSERHTLELGKDGRREGRQ